MKFKVHCSTLNKAKDTKRGLLQQIIDVCMIYIYVLRNYPTKSLSFSQKLSIYDDCKSSLSKSALSLV